MKIKVLISVVVVAIVAYVGYQYLFQGHRDVATAKVDYNITAQDLAKAFSAEEEKATLTYLNKIVEVKGEVISASPSSIELVSGVSIALSQPLSKEKSTQLSKTVQSIRGRCIGYDSLLEEIRIDQAFIVSK